MQLLWDFIPGRTTQLTDFESEDRIAQFADLLKILHQSSGEFPMASSPFRRFHDFLAKGEKNEVPFPSSVLEVRTLMVQIEKILQLYPVPLGPSHLDLSPFNIILTNKSFLLVDWVNGGLSDPYFDLATFSVFHCLVESQMKTFLEHYFGHEPSSLEWKRFIIVLPVRLFVIAVSCLLFPTENATAEYYDRILADPDMLSFSDFIQNHSQEGTKWPHWQIGLRMLKAGLDLVRSPEFQTAIDFLQQNAHTRLVQNLEPSVCLKQSGDFKGVHYSDPIKKQIFFRSWSDI